jgi:acyl-CoA reductase-like NAD-dependent aldehyde dehydrogenase
MKWFKTNSDRVATEITSQMGKPLTQSRREVDTMLDRAEILFKLAPEILKDDNVLIDAHNIQKIQKEPIGLSLLISPWNYPLLTVVGSLIPSILCGNPVLLKHSIRTPKVGQQFEEAFKSVGALGVVQHLFLDNENLKYVYKLPSINYVGFTGSVETGKNVQKEIAKTGRFINTSFELGGNDAAYVREDADIDFAVENIVDGCLYNSGQSCCSIERVLVHASVYDQFLDKAAELIAKNYILGDPFDEKTNIGPMALPDSPLALKDVVDDAVNLGAELLLGGSIVNDAEGKGRFFEPTLIKDCRTDMQVFIRENFGPLIPVARVENDDEAINIINNSEFGLTSAIYSKDYKKSSELSKRVSIFYCIFTRLIRELSS